MKKEDFTFGMTVEIADGRLLKFIGKYRSYKSNMLFEGGIAIFSINELCNNLTYDKESFKVYNIMKVWAAPNNLKNALDICTTTEVIWERNPLKEMTVAQIEKELGITNLKIVKG